MKLELPMAPDKLIGRVVSMAACPLSLGLPRPAAPVDLPFVTGPFVLKSRREHHRMQPTCCARGRQLSGGTRARDCATAAVAGEQGGTPPAAGGSPKMGLYPCSGGVGESPGGAQPQRRDSSFCERMQMEQDFPVKASEKVTPILLFIYRCYF